MTDDWLVHGACAQAEVRELLHDNSSLHALLEAGAEVVSVVIQDEFTHDVVARLPGSGTLAVFDCT